MAIEPAVLEARLAETEAMLAEHGLGALVVFAQGSAVGFASPMHGYLRYLSDWNSHHYPSALILVPGRPLVVLTPNKFLQMFASELTHFRDVRWFPLSNFGAAIAEILREAGCAGGRIGYIGRDETPVPLWERMTGALPEVVWDDPSDWFDRRRMVKDAYQIAVHRRAAALCDRLFQALPQQLRAGKQAFQVRAEMERLAYHEGADFCLTWLTVGPCADGGRLYKGLGRHVPQEGDQAVFGIYLMVDGHWGHAIRSGSLGPPGEDHRALYEVVLEAEARALDALRPGADLHAVQEAFEGVFKRRFTPDQRGVMFRFTNAHGLGLSYSEPIVGDAFPQPYAADAGDGARQSIPVAAGMLFEFHPNAFLPEVGGACVGDMVLVTADGNEILTRYPRTLGVW